MHSVIAPKALLIILTALLLLIIGVIATPSDAPGKQLILPSHIHQVLPQESSPTQTLHYGASIPHARLPAIHLDSPETHGHRADSEEADPDHHPHHGRQQIEHDRQHHGKPGADARLEGRQQFALVPGQHKEVTLTLVSEASSGTLSVEIQPSPGLALVSSTRTWQLDLSKEQLLTLPVEVMSTQDGEHHLHLFVVQDDGQGQLTTRAFANAFRVGDDLNATMLFYKNDDMASQPQAYRSLPAQEEIY